MRPGPRKNPWACFPPISNPEAPRAPRGPSYSGEREAGACLIALTYRPPKGQPPRVLVRNCYRGPGERLFVENMREWLPRKHAPRYSRRTGVNLPRLQALGFSIVRGPFMLTEPMPNCMAEVGPEAFERFWQEHRDRTPGSVEARHTPPLETPTLRLIRLHWRSRRVLEGWTADRVRRLCALWGLTPYELAELIQWAPGGIEALLSGGAVRLPGPVCVWLQFLEDFRVGRATFPELCPSMTSSTCSTS